MYTRLCLPDDLEDVPQAILQGQKPARARGLANIRYCLKDTVKGGQFEETKNLMIRRKVKWSRFIEWSNYHFNNLHLRVSLETK